MAGRWRADGGADGAGDAAEMHPPAQKIAGDAAEGGRRERVQYRVDCRIDGQDEDDEPRVQIGCSIHEKKTASSVSFISRHFLINWATLTSAN